MVSIFFLFFLSPSPFPPLQKESGNFILKFFSFFLWIFFFHHLFFRFCFFFNLTFFFSSLLFLTKASEAKERGNVAFKSGKYREAIQAYSEAIELDRTNHVLYSNRSGSFAMIKDWENALLDAKHCTELSPEWPKGWNRLGAALSSLGRYREAVTAYDKAARLDAQNVQCMHDLKTAQDKVTALEKTIPAHIQTLLQSPEPNQLALTEIIRLMGPDLVEVWKTTINATVALLSEGAITMLLTQIVPFFRQVAMNPELQVHEVPLYSTLALDTCTALIHRRFSKQKTPVQWGSCLAIKAEILIGMQRRKEALEAAESGLKVITRAMDLLVWWSLVMTRATANLQNAVEALGSVSNSLPIVETLQSCLADYDALAKVAEIDPQNRTRAQISYGSALQLLAMSETDNCLRLLDTACATWAATLATIDKLHNPGEWLNVALTYAATQGELGRMHFDTKLKKKSCDAALSTFDDALIMLPVEDIETRAELDLARASALLAHPGGGADGTLTEGGSREAMNVADGVERSVGTASPLKMAEVCLVRAQACELLGKNRDESARVEASNRSLPHLDKAAECLSSLLETMSQHGSVEATTAMLAVIVQMMRADAILGSSLEVDKQRQDALAALTLALNSLQNMSPYGNIARRSLLSHKKAKIHLWAAIAPSSPFPATMKQIETAVLNGRLTEDVKIVDPQALKEALVAAKFAADNTNKIWGLDDQASEVLFYYAVISHLTSAKSVSPLVIAQLYNSAVSDLAALERPELRVLQAAARVGVCSAAVSGQGVTKAKDLVSLLSMAQAAASTLLESDLAVLESSDEHKTHVSDVRTKVTAWRESFSAQKESAQVADVAERHNEARSRRLLLVGGGGLALTLAVGVAFYLKHRRSSS